ncbi:Peptidase M16 inactive domain-containing protein [Sinomicrobium oceani]|uniref:Peptidase M16 inactive domain-containing protein n=1 Tax=Sinomicrobium oceani TaxID=1150368 RepID=A0A1K1RX07_9FLAO|nr:insulinase family protein [Sinomicrobium oceani]SFW76303.1 Peptidase M16 inactive domain-containing protein [Sinomicrobium oceani]
MDVKDLPINPGITLSMSLLFGLYFLLFNWGCTPRQDNTLYQDPDLIKGQLDNGFQYYIKKVDDESMKGEVSMGLYGRMGNWLENEGQRGLAHLIEHMIVKTGNSCVDMDWGKSNRNHKRSAAQTTLSGIEYKFILREPQYIDEYLEVLRCYAWDTVLQRNLADTTLVREYGRTSVLAEAQKIGWKKSISREHLYLKIFGQAYKQNVESELKNIQDFGLEDLQDYYSNWYRPDMEALYVVGDIPDVRLVEASIRKLYSDLKAPDDVVTPSFSQWLDQRKVTLPGTFRVVTVEDEYNPVSQFHIYLIQPKSFLEEIVNTKKQLNNQWVRNLYKELLQNRFRRLKVDADFIGMHYQSPEITGIEGAHFFDIGFSLTQKDNGKIQSIVKLVYTELERVARYGVSPLVQKTDIVYH